MGNIIKIAIAIAFVFFILQIVVSKQESESNLRNSPKNLDKQYLVEKYIDLKDAIYSYYRRKKETPVFISDLQCTDIFDNRRTVGCASVVKNGVFYVNYKKIWASAEPYELDGKLYNKCKSSVSFADLESVLGVCEKLDINTIPEMETPDFDCGSASDKVEKIICESDKLVALEDKLLLTYKNMLSVSSDDKKKYIKDDQIKFIKIRRNKCHTSACIESITNKKIKRLELLGVSNPAL